MGKIKIDLPVAVITALNLLQTVGYKSYIVGGCVRDFLLGLSPKDYDITTPATPDEIKKVFSQFQSIDTGIKHGTVTIIIDGIPLEITTFRTDGEYIDNRHPKTVEFVQDLKLDLMRRDFTINAMAYNDQDGIIDYFGGVSDLKNGIVKCVGNPNDRFTEDALRIMRAIRFAARFRFEIEDDTRAAMLEHSKLLANVSAERINSELMKTLESMVLGTYLLEDLVRVLLPVIPEFDRFSWAELGSIIGRVSSCIMLPNLRLSLLLNFDNDEIEKVLRRLKVSNDVLNDVLTTVKHGRMILDGKYYTAGSVYNIAINESNKTYLMYGVKRLLHDVGFSAAVNAVAYAMAYDEDYNVNENLNTFISMLFNYSAFGLNVSKVSDLDINGNDLIDIGFKGKEIGKTLNTLLDMVFREIIQNDKEQLLCAAKSIKEYLI